MLAQLALVLSQRADRDKIARILPSAQQRVLQAMIARRRQLVVLSISERQRLGSCHPEIRESITLMSSFIQEQLKVTKVFWIIAPMTLMRPLACQSCVPKQRSPFAE
nr:hypothetical protein [Xenorhabdus japonica]